MYDFNCNECRILNLNIYDAAIKIQMKLFISYTLNCMCNKLATLRHIFPLPNIHLFLSILWIVWYKSIKLGLIIKGPLLSHEEFVVDLSYDLILHNIKVLRLNTYWTGPALHRRAKRIPTSELMLQNVMDPIHAAVDYSLQQSCLLNLWIANGLRWSQKYWRALAIHCLC